MISLGCGEEERATLQKVLVDIILHFEKLPKGSETDEISDTFCYATLAKAIRKFCENQSFKLLEYFTYQLYGFIKNHVDQMPITLTVTKFPPTVNLDHCKFMISDLS
jgi:FolB domain-containing protein